jgi:hypothetical protein
MGDELGKRFTDTEKWRDSWFLDLSKESKLVFYYFCDNCNLAGFVDLHDKTISFQTGIDIKDLPKVYKELGKSVVFKNGFAWVKNFLRHQKNLPLNIENYSHPTIVGYLLEKEDFHDEYKATIGYSVEELRGLQGAYKPLQRGKGIGIGIDKDTIKNKYIRDKYKDIYTNLLTYWNSFEIVKHKYLNNECLGSINSKLDNGYTEEELRQAISNYFYILNSNAYWLKYRWTLAEFLQRGLDKCMDLEKAKISYSDKRLQKEDEDGEIRKIRKEMAKQ